MRLSALGLLLLLGCAGESKSEPAAPAKPPGAAAVVAPALPAKPAGAVDAPTAPTAAAVTRCLPVTGCGCVFACSVGTAQPDGSYRIESAFWKDPMSGRIDRWCALGKCTEAFFVQLPCDGICARKPADATCHFAGTRCVSRQKPEPPGR